MLILNEDLFNKGDFLNYKICMICLGIGDADSMPLIGGHENNLARLSKVLNEKGNKITIITTPSIHTSLSVSREFNLNGAKVYSIPLKGSYGSLLYGIEFFIKAFLMVKKIDKMEHFNLIHGHSGYPILGLVVGIIGKSIKTKTIHSLYCPLGHGAFDKFLGFLYLQYIDIIISLCRNTANSLEKAGIKRKKIRFLPPIIDGEKKNLCSMKSRASSQRHLLYLGDLSETRGLSILIDALKLVVIEYPETKLLLAINLPLNKYLFEGNPIEKKISELKLSDNIVFIGIVENIIDIMCQSDIFLAPYIDIESIADYPISILEAMSVGTPVIATDVGAIPELIKSGTNGLLVHPGDAHEMANAITYLFSDEDQANEMAIKAQELVLQKFNSCSIAGKLEVIYKEILDASSN